MASIATTQNKAISCKAAVLWEFGKPYTIETIEVAPPQAREVRIRLVATGICHSDLHMARGGYKSVKLPCVPGHEGAGIVESVGPEVSSVKPGDKVFTPFQSQCKKCKYCLDEKSNYCTDFWGDDSFMKCVGYDGKPRFSLDGKPIYHVFGTSTFSEYAVIPENACVKVNPRTPLEKACIMSCGFPTGYGASHNLVDIKPSHSVAIWGMGGVGLSAVAGARDKSAGKIIGIDVLQSKEDIARKLGCTDFINAATGNVEKTIKQLTNNEGVDFAIICVPATEPIEVAIKCLSFRGNVVMVGIPDPDAKLSTLAYNFFPEKIVRGSSLGGYKPRDDLPKLVDRYLEGKLPVDQLVTHKFHLDRINDGMELLKSGKCIRSVILF